MKMMTAMMMMMRTPIITPTEMPIVCPGPDTHNISSVELLIIGQHLSVRLDSHGVLMLMILSLQFLVKL